MRVIVTRPAAQADAWVSALRARGLDAESLPLIGIAPPSDPQPVREAWAQLNEATLVMFVSANAVQQFFAARPEGLAWPDGLAAASTGPGTSDALRAAGVARIEEPAADAAQFDSEALWARIAHRPWAGRQVWVVRGEEGRDWLARQLQDAGAQLRFVHAYRRQPPVLSGAQQAVLAQALAAPADHCWLFSSSEAVGHLLRLAPGADWRAQQALASHPRIAQTAHEAGFGRVALVPAGTEGVLRHLGVA
jgi:uroporphyrinogen-III synthase